MSISATSYVSNVASQLQQLSDLRQQQIQTDLDVGESTRRARQQSVEQSFQDSNKQAERVNEIRKAGMLMRSGSIDVWA